LKEEAMPIVRKLVVALLMMLMLFAASTSASAAPSATTTHETVRGETVTWSLPADQCPSLPAGVSVDGTGQRIAVTKTKVNADGSTQIVINDLVTGAAVGSNGATYHFVYHNHSTQNVPSAGGPIQISMTDSFVLNGDGGAGHMSVGFNWRWTFTPPALWPPHDNWQQISTRGDPFLCDPI
jgi:hypothetical protein